MSVESAAPDISDTQGTSPRHVAIIMDGNNRWAKQRGMPGPEGHRAGEETLHQLVDAVASQTDIDVLSVFAFSSENWRRPENEVAALMSIFLMALTERVREMHANNIRVRFIGDPSRFSPELQQGMQDAEALTAANTSMTLVIAVNYGGQWDMAHAARIMAREVAAGRLDPEAISPELMGRHVQMADLPPVDLLIRTGGELRISNFLLWQTAYAEFFFSGLLWPDFDFAALRAAVADYTQRQRRFGRTSEQVEQAEKSGAQGAPRA
jgi:undecaprenyl diphosphate synthase